MGKIEKRIKKVLKILKDGVSVSDTEYLVEKISIHQLYLLSSLQMKEHLTNTNNLKKRTTTSVFLEPEEDKVKISFQKVAFEISALNLCAAKSRNELFTEHLRES